MRWNGRNYRPSRVMSKGINPPSPRTKPLNYKDLTWVASFFAGPVGGGETPVPTLTPTPTLTPSPTLTPTPSSTPPETFFILAENGDELLTETLLNLIIEAGLDPTPTPTPTQSITPSITPTQSITPSITPSSVTPTPTPTPSSTPAEIFFISAENGDFILTEGGDNLVTEFNI